MTNLSITKIRTHDYSHISMEHISNETARMIYFKDTLIEMSFISQNNGIKVVIAVKEIISYNNKYSNFSGNRGV